jgi:hypothetical protein
MRSKKTLSSAVAVVVVLLGIDAADARASHVSCGQTIVASTVLDSDLVNCPGDGIVIGASNVTLDLNGHTIDGSSSFPWSGHDRGVRALSVRGLRIRNGTIQEFSGAVQLIDVDNSVISGLVVQGGNPYVFDGIHVEGNPDGNRIRDNTLLTGGITVAEGAWSGDELYRPSDNRVERNYTDGGILLLYVDGSLVADNVTRDPIVTIGIFESGYRGNAAEENVIERNDVSDSWTTYGIVLSNDARRNIVRDNDVAGAEILTMLGFDNRVEGNRVHGSPGAGIRIGNGSYEASRTLVAGNEVYENVDGVRVDPSATGTVLDLNVARQNSDDGIDVDNAQTTISRNSAYQNGDWGIEAVAGVLDGGGNGAWSNGRPAQCLNVSCQRRGSLALAPQSAQNEVGTRHCVTAFVIDLSGERPSGVTVRFSVSGASDTEDASQTNASGEAGFCYEGPELAGSDAIAAFADLNGDGDRDPGEPGDTAFKTWVLPASDAGCRINDSGRIAVRNGDRATFSGTAAVSSTGILGGSQRYVDQGPAEPLRMRSVALDAITCSVREATIFGRGRIEGTGQVSFRIDLFDGGPGGRADSYRILLSSGYDSGVARLEGGNVSVEP